MAQSSGEKGVSKKCCGGQVLDGSDIMELVGNDKVFSSYVDHKFAELDIDKDGKLSVKELQPAVVDLGAALGLPAHGSSPDADHIYSEVLNEFTHGKQEKVSKTEFKEVLSDILLGMAAGLKRDPIVILRMDGEDLNEFITNPSSEPEIIAIFSRASSADGTNIPSLRTVIIKALQQLTVDHGMPPSSDSWVMSNIVEPALQACTNTTASQEAFIEEFKKVIGRVVQHLKEQPVIVAHSEHTFDGSGIKRLLSNKFELDKTLDAALRDLPRDRSGKLSKEYLRVALDSMAPSASLPPYGAVNQMDNIVNEVVKMVGADDGKIVPEEEFKKLMLEIVGSIMLQLEGNTISVSSNSVVHEPLATASTLFPQQSLA
ncbi:hypothetical protein MKW94_006984 [Papaver nudicaule]|uniref:EF-hand domain-containing protein n=1 Tax=Papaver nudicaule TaxID=74823 RepID=A0AA41RZ54_PAPNU|nr:hypothetical protein [Papaver nudicaule]MCL7027436.1 hypothetical protein [Papaver nudicaule]